MNWKTLVVIIAAGLLLRSRRNRFMLSKNFGLDEFVKSKVFR